MFIDYLKTFVSSEYFFCQIILFYFIYCCCIFLFMLFKLVELTKYSRDNDTRLVFLLETLTLS
jgi:hypothetical protein